MIIEKKCYKFSKSLFKKFVKIKQIMQLHNIFYKVLL